MVTMSASAAIVTSLRLGRTNVKTQTRMTGKANEGRKESFLWMQIVSFVLLLFSISITYTGPVMTVFIAICLGLSTGLAYFAMRKKFGLIGLLLFIASAYCFINFTIFQLTQNP